MFIVDDVLCFPFSGILWIVRQVYDAARQELAADTETITAELMDLHMLLEAGEITSEVFDAREKELLDRLDEIEECGVRVRAEAYE
ncbi:MAG: gas vesicle protein GvpG [Syntrophobacteraceae bacterium]|jgi:hypothetical protein